MWTLHSLFLLLSFACPVDFISAGYQTDVRLSMTHLRRRFISGNGFGFFDEARCTLIISCFRSVFGLLVFQCSTPLYNCSTNVCLSRITNRFSVLVPFSLIVLNSVTTTLVFSLGTFLLSCVWIALSILATNFPLDFSTVLNILWLKCTTQRRYFGNVEKCAVYAMKDSCLINVSTPVIPMIK